MFQDDDIRASFRQATRSGTGGVAGYGQLGLYARRDDNGDGIEGFTAKCRRERDEQLSLAHVANDRPGRHSVLRWR